MGVPGRIVSASGARLPSKTLDQTNLPDPVVERLLELQDELRVWEKKVEDERAKATVREVDTPETKFGDSTAVSVQSTCQ